MIIRTLIYFFIFLFFFYCKFLNAEENNLLSIEITANKMEWDDINEVAYAIGDATATQGQRILKADKLVAKIREMGENNEQSEIYSIDATGNVVFLREGEKAFGNKGRYNIVDEIIILEGKVSLRRGEDIIYGDKLEINLKTGKSRVLANQNKEKVKMKFTPASKEGKK